jgi:hypothetical protein
MSKEGRDMRKASREQQRAERAAESNTEQQKATEINREQPRHSSSSFRQILQKSIKNKRQATRETLLITGAH